MIVGAAPVEQGRFVTVVMELGEGVGGTGIRGVGSIRVLVDEDRVRELGASDWRAIIVRVPEAMIAAAPEQLGRAERLGNLVAFPAIVTPLIDRVQAALRDPAVEPPFSEESWWARSIAAIAAALTGVQPTPDLVARARRAQVERIVARYSSDRRLTPDAIAAAIGVSRRTLYELAEPYFGGISEYVRTARAMRAARMLADESSRGRSAADIAEATGFSSARHMSRALVALNSISAASLRPTAIPGDRATA